MAPEERVALGRCTGCTGQRVLGSIPGFTIDGMKVTCRKAQPHEY